MHWPNERVLVIPRSLFDSLGAFEGLSTDTARYLPAFLDPANNHFLARDTAEEDPSYKQIIPYAVFHCRDRFLHYVRGGKTGEKRLADKGSIGIGGHINSEDAEQASLEKSTYLTGVEREMKEELIIRSPYRQCVVALINDDNSPVGKVHIGVVHLFDLETEDVSSNEATITSVEFLSRDELNARRDRLETWSTICLDHFDQILAAAAQIGE